uniref:Uncharacterized protein n=1 Tax=Myripristis murdjan TaxID=586833 RepID=A0A667WJT3_9TELE
QEIDSQPWNESQSDEDSDLEEFLYGIQGSCATDLYRHPQLDTDIEAVRTLYSHAAVSVREYGTIDDVDVDLHINVSFLDEEVAKAWMINPSEPIVIRLHLSPSQYLDGPAPSVEVFQPSRTDSFGPGVHLQNILKTFISQEWKNLTNDNITVQQKSKHTWFRPGGTIKKFRARLSIWSPISRYEVTELN